MNDDNKRSVGGLGLIGDIGSTNARFALRRGQRLESIEVLTCADYPWSELAVHDYLARIGESVVNTDSVRLACAGPAGMADSRLANNHRVINRAAFREELRLDHLPLANNLNTMAWVASRLGAGELVQTRAGSAQADCARLTIGPGTGPGIDSLLPLGGGCWEVLPCEGGYVSLPVTPLRDSALWRGLQTCYGHVSAECTLFGNGLLALYEISRALDEVAVRASNTVEVGALAMAGDAQADAVLEYLFLWLVRVAGSVVLTVGTLGGVHITGGIVPRSLECFIASGLAETFARRGKTSDVYLQDVPVWVITAEYPGLLGVGIVLQQALDVEG